MEYVAKTCRVVKTSEILSAEPEDGQTVVAITIDDAFSNVYENALPILKQYNLSAAVFAPVGNLGSAPQWDIEEGVDDRELPVMTYKQLIEIDRDGFEVFSHTFSHPRLTEVDEKKLHDEVAGSKRILERILGHEVTAISYPYGIHDDQVCKAVKQAGYSHGFTIEPVMIDRATDNFRIGRFEISPQESFVKFKLKCSGAFQASTALSSIKAIALRALKF
jgi:peptidoglycan/xylan/chitin deacetylase (PgdA/CDA1 family)